jgi:hypothetical protein
MLSDLSMRSSSWENDAFIPLYSAIQFLLSRSLLNISVEFKDIGLRKTSKYYLNLLNCWSEFLSLNKIKTKENIFEQHIFGNLRNKFPILLTYWNIFYCKKVLYIFEEKFLFSRILSFFINSHVFFTVNG